MGTCRSSRWLLLIVAGLLSAACSSASPGAPSSQTKAAPTESSKPASKAEPESAPKVVASAAPKTDVGAPSKSAAGFDEQAVASFYRGKTLRLVVGYAPGGGNDLAARMLARHMPKYLPGDPNIVVENHGAATMLAANTVFNTEPKDGTVFANFNPQLLMARRPEPKTSNLMPRSSTGWGPGRKSQ